MKTENIHEGDLTADLGEVYPYTKITGSVYASGADTKTAFPKLTSVGGYVDASGDRSHVKQNDSENMAAQKCRALLLSATAAMSSTFFSKSDGSLMEKVAGFSSGDGLL